MEELGNVIVEVIAGVIVNIILSIPGAFVRWLFYFRTKSYSELLADDFVNPTVGGFTIAAMIGLVFIVKHYLN